MLTLTHLIVDAACVRPEWRVTHNANVAVDILPRWVQCAAVTWCGVRINMIDLVTNLKEERARLEAELQSDPRHVKIRRINDLLSVYSKDERPADTPPAKPPVQRKARTKLRRRKKLSKRALIRMTVHEVIAPTGSAHRKDILAALIAEGVMGKEANPMAALAAYLSRSKDEFETDGHGNFSVRKQPVSTSS